MENRFKYWTLLILSIPLSVIAWHDSWSSSLVPKEDTLVTVEGSTETVKYNSSARWGDAQFTISGNSHKFFYPGFYHNFNLLGKSLVPGSHVRLRVTDEEKPEIWRIEVNGLLIASESEIIESKKENNRVGIYLGIVFTLCTLFSIWKLARAYCFFGSYRPGNEI